MDKKGSAKALFCPLLHYFHKLFCFSPDTASGYRLFWFAFYRELDQFNLGVPQFCRLYAELANAYLLVQLRETLQVYKNETAECLVVIRFGNLKGRGRS